MTATHLVPLVLRGEQEGLLEEALHDGGAARHVERVAEGGRARGHVQPALVQRLHRVDLRRVLRRRDAAHDQPLHREKRFVGATKNLFVQQTRTLNVAPTVWFVGRAKKKMLKWTLLRKQTGLSRERSDLSPTKPLVAV